MPGSLVAFLLAIYAANVLGPPPPDPRAIGAAGLLMWLFVPWAWWIDRARAVREPAATLAAS